MFILQIFSRRQSRVVGNPSHTAEADATQTRQFCRVRPASLAIRWSDGAGSAKAVEARVDVEATDRWLHAVDNAPDLQSAVSDHRHRVVVVAEVLGVGQLVRMRRRRRLGQVTFPARQHLVHRRHDRRIVQLDLPTEHVTLLTQYAFSALTLSAGRQKEHPACKNRVMRCWCHGVIICLDRGADCLHTVQLVPLHPQTPSSLASFKSRLALLFWYRLTQVLLEKRPLNGCCCCCCCCCCYNTITDLSLLASTSSTCPSAWSAFPPLCSHQSSAGTVR